MDSFSNRSQDLDSRSPDVQPAAEFQLQSNEKLLQFDEPSIDDVFVNKDPVGGTTPQSPTMVSIPLRELEELRLGQDSLDDAIHELDMAQEGFNGTKQRLAEVESELAKKSRDLEATRQALEQLRSTLQAQERQLQRSDTEATRREAQIQDLQETIFNMKTEQQAATSPVQHAQGLQQQVAQLKLQLQVASDELAKKEIEQSKSAKQMERRRHVVRRSQPDTVLTEMGIQATRLQDLESRRQEAEEHRKLLDARNQQLQQEKSLLETQSQMLAQQLQQLRQETLDASQQNQQLAGQLQLLQQSTLSQGEVERLKDDHSKELHSVQQKLQGLEKSLGFYKHNALEVSKANLLLKDRIKDLEAGAQSKPGF